MIEMNLRYATVLVISGVAAAFDYKNGHIPNWLVGVGLALGAGGPVVAALAQADLLQGLVVAGRAVAGFIACGAVPLLLFRLKALGGGDVKLLATVGAQLGATLGLELSFCAFVVAASYVPVRLAHAALSLRKPSGSVPRASARVGAASRALPEPLAVAFAPCLFVAAVVVTASHWST
jgi:Flp pilus assembly protein protease CpaA